LGEAGNVEFHYGCFNRTFASVNTVATNHTFVAVEGQNLAGLLTPQVERAFAVPVDSAMLVAILTKINAGEALSNQCHAASEPTRWTATVSEWATVPSNGVVTLNFFPVDASPNVRDAWTGTDFTGFNYDEINKTLTVTDPADAPSQLIISNQVYLGCAQVFTNDYGGVVTNLTDSTLAGIPVNEAFVLQVREKIAAILTKFQDTNTTTCTSWTLTNILVAAGNSNGQWTAISGGLLLPQHFTELKNVADLLTMELACCGACCLPDGSCADNVISNQCTVAGGIYQGDGSVCSNVVCTEKHCQAVWRSTYDGEACCSEGWSTPALISAACITNCESIGWRLIDDCTAELVECPSSICTNDGDCTPTTVPDGPGLLSPGESCTEGPASLTVYLSGGDNGCCSQSETRSCKHTQTINPVVTCSRDSDYPCEFIGDGGTWEMILYDEMGGCNDTEVDCEGNPHRWTSGGSIQVIVGVHPDGIRVDLVFLRSYSEYEDCGTGSFGGSATTIDPPETAAGPSARFNTDTCFTGSGSISGNDCCTTPAKGTYGVTVVPTFTAF
jgi:hypothetical protein